MKSLDMIKKDLSLKKSNLENGHYPSFEIGELLALDVEILEIVVANYNQLDVVGEQWGSNPQAYTRELAILDWVMSDDDS